MAKLAGYRKILLCSSFCVALGFGATAHAQMVANFDNNVMVDLSVLEDNGARQPNRPVVGTSYNQNLPKVPPTNMPVSKFFGLPNHIEPAQTGGSQLMVPQAAPKSRIVLKRPSVSTTSTASAQKPMLPSGAIKLTKPSAPAKPVERKVEVAKAAPKPMVKKAPEPVVVEQPAPKVVEKPALPSAVVAKVPEAPKPVAAPSKLVETVKEVVEAPKAMTPKVAEAPKVEEKPAPAPATVMAEAPPPPPVSAVEPKEVESAISAQVEEAKKATSVASLTPATESSVRVAFQNGQSKLPSSAQSDLKKLADDLRAHPDDRVQLLAYAGGDDLSASKARRLSLSRALAVRSYLIGEGVRSTRIDVRALGNKTTEEPFDRVDVQITPR